VLRGGWGGVVTVLTLSEEVTAKLKGATGQKLTDVTAENSFATIGYLSLSQYLFSAV
jgi:hypothetical protein